MREVQPTELKMKRKKWALIAAFVLVSAAAAVILFFPQLVPWYVGTCTTDSIPEAERKPAEDAAVGFVQALLSPEPRQAYLQLSAKGRTLTTEMQLDSAAQRIQSQKPFGPMNVTGMCLLEIIFGSDGTMHCPVSGKTQQDITQQDIVAFGAARKQAHVLLASDAGPVALNLGGEWTFVVSMDFEDGTWRVNSFHAGPSLIAARDGETLWVQAREQRSRGHLFNATLLYATANNLLNRGAMVRLGVKQDFDKDYATFIPLVPVELQGQPPFVWTLNGKSFSVNNVSYSGVQNRRVFLVIDQRSQGWNGDRDAESRNHELLDAFIEAHPEWIETFDVIAVRALKPDLSRAFGTIYDKVTGYRPPPDFSD